MSPISRQGWLFKLNFQFSNFSNTRKCELGQFSLRQSHVTDIIRDFSQLTRKQGDIYPWKVSRNYLKPKVSRAKILMVLKHS